MAGWTPHHPPPAAANPRPSPPPPPPRAFAAHGPCPPCVRACGRAVPRAGYAGYPGYESYHGPTGAAGSTGQAEHAAAAAGASQVRAAPRRAAPAVAATAPPPHWHACRHLPARGGGRREQQQPRHARTPGCALRIARASSAGGDLGSGPRWALPATCLPGPTLGGMTASARACVPKACRAAVMDVPPAILARACMYMRPAAKRLPNGTAHQPHSMW